MGVGGEMEDELFSGRFPRSWHIITALSFLAAMIGIPALVFSGAGW